MKYSCLFIAQSLKYNKKMMVFLKDQSWSHNPFYSEWNWKFQRQFLSIGYDAYIQFIITL
jgi:hypothetical protein